MSINHNGGNIIPEVTREEHDGELNAKRTSLVSAATIYAVVNTGAAGVGNSIVTIANTPLSTQIIGNVTISDSKNYIGLTTTTIGNTPTVFIGTPTLYAVVNTAAVGITNSIVTVAGGSLYGNVTLDDGSLTGIVGNVTLSDSKGFIGLTTTTLGASPAFVGIVTIANSNIRSIAGNITITDSKGFIGLTTSVLGAGVAGIGFTTVNVAGIASGSNYIGLASVNVGGTVAVTQSGTWDEVGINDSGNSITIDGNVGLLAGVNGIGFATIAVGSGSVGLNAGTAGIGFATVNVAAIATGDNNIGNVDIASEIPTGTKFIGLVTVAPHSLVGNLTLSDSKGFIGLNTVVNGAGNRFIGLVTSWVSGMAGNVTLSDAKTYVGLVTATLGVGTTFIGLVTSWSRNAGTTKTLVNMPVTLSTGSVQTIAVPSTNNTMYITNLILNSDATVRVSIKSGVTYLTGNASIGITLNPGGGWVETGAPDSPTYIGCPSGALVVEKLDLTGTIARVGGKLVYYSE